MRRINEARGRRTMGQMETLATVSVPNNTGWATYDEDTLMKDVDETEWTSFTGDDVQDDMVCFTVAS